MRRLFILFISLFATSTFAQHPQGYSGWETREIKALSGDQIKQYRAGAGMSYALAAELNQYPGPLHALELADELKLTAEQRATLRTLMDGHKAEARAIGAQLVEVER